jgi:uncharacterized protein YijF (DUF1287 family)
VKLPRFVVWVVLMLCLVFSSSAQEVSSSPGPVSSTAEFNSELSWEIVQAAKLQATQRVRYRMAYPPISYPAGDISPYEALCCDVIVRALRAAGINLQELVYEDFLENPTPYRGAARFFSNTTADRNWAHRRTAFLNQYFKRHFISLPARYTPSNRDKWQPGDLVIFQRGGWETWHIALISDATDSRSQGPLLIDAWNLPGVVSEVHHLSDYGAVGGHYRIDPTFRDSLPEDHRDRAREAWRRYLAAHEKRPATAYRPPLAMPSRGRAF